MVKRSLEHRLIWEAYIEEFNLGDDETEGGLGGDIIWGELKRLFESLSLGDVKEGQYLDFSYKYLVDKYVEAILKEMNYKIKKGVTLDFSGNEIQGDCLLDLASIIPEEWVTINFSNNSIEGKNAAYFIFNWVFPEKVTINLSYAWIEDGGIEEYYEEYKHKIVTESEQLGASIKLWKEAKLNLSGNYIWDKWAKILMNNMELEEWAILNLSNNKISEDMKKELQKWEKSYHDEWINCTVIV